MESSKGNITIPTYFNWSKLQIVPKHQIHYQMWGEDHVNAVVCLHGSLRNSHDFDYIARVLSRFFKVVAFDVVGRGHSQWFEKKQCYNYHSYVQDSIRLLSLLKLKKVHWIGTSMGGIIGMVIAALFPSKIKSLTLNDIGISIAASDVKKMRKYAALDPSFNSFEDVISYCKMAYSGYGIKEEQHWEHCAQHTVYRDENNQYKLLYDPCIVKDYVTGTGSNISLRRWWRKVICPVHLIRGSDSAMVTEAIELRMLQDRPDMKTYCVQGAGHAPAFISGELIDTVLSWIISVS
ncbi:alpha/beta fold hydrolase [Candidatus Sneabacter namystus]|uniref:Alpha/beta hydrolase n=1 Tax=Candidatus Sneabacter namystus TaxID=2601646 RepID=A0A5C0UIS2_9RICK|nr:alpha/beta hydrolase [Candidatus Sneabacter namystus]QEK39650.1 alpha/beta hydrolase [Candidatus Sneabacter namystus]